MHYHVIYGLDGYMPDSNDTYRTKKEAINGLRWFRDMIKESESQKEEYADKLIGSIKNEYFTIGSSSLYITTCLEEECLTELGDMM